MNDPVLDIAKAFVLDQYQKIQGMDPADAEAAITEVAALIIGPHEAALAEFAHKTREGIEAQRASLAVQKRAAEEQCDAGLATVDQALELLAAPVG